MNTKSKKELHHKLTEGISSLFNRSGVYDPFKNETSIRLLRIKGDHGASILRCTMTEADLNDKPVYEALSYTWQKDQSGFLEVVSLSSRIGKVAKQWEKLSNIGVGNETIICNDQCIKVTPNLHDALLHLRRRSRRRTAIWIDSICINQNDLRERNAQVNMMGRIFDSARQVVVWLGKATETTTRTIEYMSKLPSIPNQKPDDVKNECTAVMKYDSNIQEEQSTKESRGPKTSLEHIFTELLRKGPEEWLHLFRLFRGRWFRRTWVLQEIVLAKQLQFYIGPYEISLETLEKGLQRLLDLGFYASQATDTHMRTHPLSQHLESIRMMLEARSYHVQNQLWPLEKCVGLTRSRECGDARDKVFAILSISSNDSLCLPLRHRDRSQGSTASDPGFLQADYSKTVPEVYLDCFRCLLSKIGPDALSLVDQSYERSLELPTWVPDFNAPLWPKPFKDYGTSIYSSGSTSSADIRISKSGRTLSLRAALWDSVSTIGEELPKVLFFAFIRSSNANAGLLRISELLNRKIGPTYTHTNEPVSVAFGRTILADIYKGFHPVPNEVIEMCSALTSKSRMQTPAARRNEEARRRDRRRSNSSRRPEPTQRSSDSTLVNDNGFLKPGARPDLARSLSTNDAKSRSPSRSNAMVSAHVSPPGEESPNSAYTRNWNWDDKAGTFTSTHTGTAPLYPTSEVSEAVYDINAGRRWFVTRKGYLGLGPETMQPGDQVVLIPGATLPYIFQSIGNAKGEESEFTLVGESYVHGLMRGEALEGEEAKWTRINVK